MRAIPDPQVAPHICPTCAARRNPDGTPADARIMWVGKRAVVQHRRHCPQYDPRLAALLAAHRTEDARPCTSA